MKIWHVPTLLFCLSGILWAQSPADSASHLPHNWVGFNAGWSQVASQNTMSWDVRIGYVPVPILSVGIWLARAASVSIHRDSTINGVGYSSYGFFAEPVFSPSSLIHLTMPVKLGFSNINLSIKEEEDVRSGGWFFQSDVGLYLEANLTQYTHFALGGGVREASGAHGHRLSSDDFRTWHIDGTLKWGDL